MNSTETLFTSKPAPKERHGFWYWVQCPIWLFGGERRTPQTYWPSQPVDPTTRIAVLKFVPTTNSSRRTQTFIIESDFDLPRALLRLHNVGLRLISLPLVISGVDRSRIFNRYGPPVDSSDALVPARFCLLLVFDRSNTKIFSTQQILYDGQSFQHGYCHNKIATGERSPTIGGNCHPGLQTVWLSEMVDTSNLICPVECSQLRSRKPHAMISSNPWKIDWSET